MAFAVGVAHAPSLDGWLTSGLSPRMDHGKYPVLIARNELTTRNNTVNLFIDSVDPDYEYAASVITACADQTVFALQCTATQLGVPTEACGPNGLVSAKEAFILPISMHSILAANNSLSRLAG